MAHIRDHHFDMIGYSLVTPSVNAAIEYSQRVKGYDPTIINIVGGPHAIIEPVETLQIMSGVDYLFRGEAELGICQLAALLEREPAEIPEEDLGKVENLVWRRRDEVVCNPRVYTDNLDAVPYPAWHLIGPENYPLAPMGLFTNKKRVAPMITTRGCPYPCTFCTVGQVSGKKMRMRSVPNIIDEIRLLQREYGIEEINILDDNFTQMGAFVSEFCTALIDNEIDISWSCPGGIRLDTLNAPLLQLMEKSGCYSFGVGIEFGTQKMLDITKKHLTLEKIREKVDLVKSVTDIKITGFFIVGHPQETVEDVEATIDFACELKIDKALFSNFYPFPGTSDYEELKKSGLSFKELYDSIFVHSVIYNSEHMSREMIAQLRGKAFRRFYLRPHILWSTLRGIKTLSQVQQLIGRVMHLRFVPEKA